MWALEKHYIFRWLLYFSTGFDCQQRPRDVTSGLIYTPYNRHTCTVHTFLTWKRVICHFPCIHTTSCLLSNYSRGQFKSGLYMYSNYFLLTIIIATIWAGHWQLFSQFPTKKKQKDMNHWRLGRSMHHGAIWIQMRFQFLLVQTSCSVMQFSIGSYQTQFL